MNRISSVHLPHAVWEVCHAIRWRWKKAIGRTGEFTAEEDSDRSRSLTIGWEQSWPGSLPVGYLLRANHGDRWVRFHSLPRSKRYAESVEEYQEILTRHHAILAELPGGSKTGSLVIIAADWDARDLESGWSKSLLPGAWPWRTVTDDDSRWFFWVKTGVADAELDKLLLAAADDASRFVMTNPELGWLYCPYDGGMDVILPDSVERDALRDKHSTWLSAHPQGL